MKLFYYLYFSLTSLLPELKPIINPNATSKIATTNCKPSTIKTNPPVTNNFITIPQIACTNAVIVTININTIGIYNINPFLPVTFKKTANEIKTIAANNWLADPNNGQILTYPPKLNKYPQTKEIIVETYLLVKT